MSDDREWCRAFIDHHCIYRSPPGEFALTGTEGTAQAWQFYLPIAILDQEFAERIGRLFWNRFAPLSPCCDGKPRIQLCGCESGGSLLVSALQASGYRAGHNVPAFMIKKAAKTYGLGNWLEGVVDPDLPVLLVDDIVGSGKTIRAQCKRLEEFGLKIAGMWAIADCKAKVPEVDTLFDASDFARLHPEYTRKYGKEPEFMGTVT